MKKFINNKTLKIKTVASVLFAINCLSAHGQYTPLSPFTPTQENCRQQELDIVREIESACISATYGNDYPTFYAARNRMSQERERLAIAARAQLNGSATRRRLLNILRNPNTNARTRIRATRSLLTYIANLPLDDNNPFFQWNCPAGYEKNRSARRASFYRIPTGRNVLNAFEKDGSPAIMVPHLQFNTTELCTNGRNSFAPPDYLIQTTGISSFLPEFVTINSSLTAARSPSFLFRNHRIGCSERSSNHSIPTVDSQPHSFTNDHFQLISSYDPRTIESYENEHQPESIYVSTFIQQFLPTECRSVTATGPGGNGGISEPRAPSNIRTGGPGGGNGGILDGPENAIATEEEWSSSHHDGHSAK